MKPDAEPQRLDLIERAHLKDPLDSFHVIHRYEPQPGLEGLVQRYWIPVWSVPPGQESTQQVLQYPVCLVVVSPDYARFYGVVPGLSSTTLSGDGWAVGIMLSAAAGFLVGGRSVDAWTDRHVPVAEVLGEAGDRLVARVRAAMAPDPHSPDAHRAAMDAYDEVLRPFLPVDEEGQLVNRLVALVESRPDLTRVAQLCEELGLSERALQRLVRRRLGLPPKWLIQRRRLQEAAVRLRAGTATAAKIAAELGYADQPHFVRDFARVTAMTPGEFAARFTAPGGDGGSSADVG